MNAVLSPPAESRPWKVMTCVPAVTANGAVVDDRYDVSTGRNVPTTWPSTRTWKSSTDVPKLPRWAAWNDSE